MIATAELDLEQEKVKKLNGLIAHLNKRVIGQEAAIAALCEALVPGEMGLTPPGAPRTLLLVCGPTGTGKTKAVLEASQFLYRTSFICRVDMAEYSTEAAVPRLLGENRSDLGYLGEQLAKLEETGGHFILLDEIEKAHPKVSDMFLGMEAARITLANGKTVDLSPYHIFVTSNLGAKELSEAGDAMPERTRRRVVEDAAKAHFRPEVLARFAGVVMYKKLSQSAQMAICRQMLDEELAYLEGQVAKQLGHPHKIHVGDGVFQRLVSEGYHRELGARPMRNVVQKRTRNAVANALLKGANGGIFRGVRESTIVLVGENGYEVAPRRGGAFRLC
jgi:ATP-dependent Clp protease ATP-binding subunit ClpB